MYLLGAETELEWELEATASVIERTDLDLLITNPEGVSVYISSAIPVDKFTAPTELLPGSAKYLFTPDLEGLWTLRLVTGTELSYTQLSKVSLQVLDNTTETNPAATYIRTQVTSEAIKVPCVTSTTENIVLSGLQTLNGVLVEEGDRVLVKDQTDPAENGIYDAYTEEWLRSIDAYDLINGAIVLDANGDNFRGATYGISFSGEFIPGTTEVSITQRLSRGSAEDAEAAAESALANRLLTDDNVVATNADVVTTNGNAVQTNADVLLAQASADNAQDNATNTAIALANAGSMLGINFGDFDIVDGELIVTHLSTTTPEIVDGELILTYEDLGVI